ncbi:MAG: SusC/RagA family TonB-linked outer membrane protein [Paludibacter sp.]|nr:SusC/RagA family TonB-linked outer membrane protein [Paludibacter sp.]
MEELKNSFRLVGLSILLFAFYATGSGQLQANKTVAENTVTFKGLVRDAHSKKPVAAAQVSVLNRNISAVTDENGQFVVKVFSQNDIVQISAYDFNKREIAIQGRDSAVIDLYPNKFSAYFKSISSITGDIDNSNSLISAKSIEDIDKTTVLTADEMIQTALGGDARAITRSGAIGAGASLFIRGINSLNANAQPLLVIDGVIMNSDYYGSVSIHEGYFANILDNIDMNDVESITVLKDGTSIYGSKAANGVILINTKRGKSMVTKISLNVLTGTTTQPGTIPMMNSEQYRVYASEMLNSSGYTGNDVSDYGFLETDRSAAKVYNTYHNNTDWADQIYQNGYTNNYLINVNGGDEKALYYFSLGLTQNTGIVKTTDFQRIVFRLNADINLFKQLQMGLNIGLNRNQRTLLDDGMDQYSSPTWIGLIKSPFLSPYNYTNQGQLTSDYADADIFGISNPSGLVDASVNFLKKYRFNIGLQPTYKINNEFTLTTKFDYSVDKSVEGKFIPQDYTPERELENYGTIINSIYSQVMRNSEVFDDTRLTYTKKLDSENLISAMYGWRYIYNYYESDYAEEYNSGSNNNTTITGDYSYLQATGLNNETKSLSNYVNVDYNYAGRYFLNGAVAMDGSSRFGTETLGGVHLFGHSWGIFPQINGAWLMSAETFMKKMSFIDFCKLKAGYGITGNDGIQDYLAYTYFKSTRFAGQANGLIISNLQDTPIQWETTAKANIGIDLGLFNDRLNLTLDLFTSKTSDLLVLRDLPDYTGLSQYWENSGEMKNSGFELSASLKMLNLKDFTWELGASVGHYKNEITALPDGDYTTDVYDGQVLTAVGQSAGVFYGYKTKGVFSTEAEATAANLKIKNADGTYTNFGAGDVIFEDVANANGVKDGVIDENDKQVIGDPNPDFYGAFNSKWTFKRITLNTIFTYSYGNDIYNYFRSQLESGSNFNNQSTIMNTRWTAEGQVTDQPKAVYGDPMGNARFSDRWIEDGSYLRLKTVSLSYDLPFKSKYIEGINLWVSANNLVTFTNYLGLDPEFSAGNSVYYQGVDAGLLPLTKSYYLGIKLNL